MSITQKYLSYDNITCAAGDFTPYTVNGMRDLSMANRKGLAQTTRKGVPLLAKYAVTISPAIFHNGTSSPDGNTLFQSADAVDSGNTQVIARFYGAPNNWVTRNACVKIHDSRETFFKNSGIKKSERGAYDHEIRYKYRASVNNLLTPVNGELDLQIDPTDGQAYADDELTNRTPYTGGTWDETKIIYPDDATGATLHLIGGHSSEETTTGFDSLCAGQLYLSSRGTIDSDSNEEFDTTPFKDSILQKMMHSDAEGIRDEVRAEVRDQADNPPYDLTILNNDQYDAVELGRLSFVVGQASSATAIIEAPLGMFEAHFACSAARAATNISGNVEMTVELLGLSEM